MKMQEIRAVYDDDTITVYQAFSGAIARAAVDAQTLVSPFKMERMTWIKPSFLWMMYRSGWAGKLDQEHVLAIRIKRTGWEWALRNSCLSHFNAYHYGSNESWKKHLKASPVRIQWDPEKDLHLQDLPYRSIQVGLSGAAVYSYVKEWIVRVDDITSHCHTVAELVQNGEFEKATSLLPHERPYPVEEGVGFTRT